MSDPPQFKSGSPPSEGSIQRGLLTGCGVQVGVLVVVVVAGSVGLLKDRYLVLAFAVLQWLILITLIRNQRGSSQQTTVGLMVAGCLGTLLSTACAGMMSL